MSSRGSTLAFLAGALPVFIISVGGRATDNMVSTTLPLLGIYVFGMGTVYGGIANSVYNFAGLLSTFVVNPRISGELRRRVFVAAGGAIVVSCLLLAVSDAVTAIALGFSISFCLGLVSPITVASISLGEKETAERLVALYALGLSTSLVLGPALESYLLNFGYTVVFVVFASVSAAAFIASWRMKFTSVPKETRSIGPSAKRGITGGLLLSSIFSIPFAALTAFLTIFAAQTFSVDAAIAYSSFIPLFVVSFFARAYMTARPFRGLKRPVIASTLVVGFGILGMVLAPSFSTFLVVMAFLGIPHGVLFTLSLIVVARTSGEDERNAAVSRLSAYSNVVSTLVPLVVGYAIEAAGIHLTFLFLLVPVLVTGYVFARTRWNVLS